MKKILEKIKTKKAASGVLIALIMLWVYFHHSHNTMQATLSAEQGIVLSSHDIASVKNENFLMLVPISGELYPLEQTTIIAKVGAEVQSINVREGESIKKNQLLATLNTDDLEQAVKDKEAALSAAKASYQFSLSALQRYKKLLDKKYYSQNDYDAAIQQLRINEAGLTQAKAALNEAKLQLSYTRIVSSIAGIVSERDIEPGMNLSVGQTLFKVVNLDRLEWHAMVPADEISHIKVNQTATFEVDGVQEVFSGNVVRINPSTVSGTRAYYAYIAVNNPNHHLKNGMFATGHITLSEKTNTLVIPFEAVKKEQTNKTYVFKIDANHRIKKQIVTLGLVDALNNKAEVLSGLKEGELVIASSAEVQSGDVVILPASFSIHNQGK
jgi:RND family efflux transporter MFP subunit